jgi:hypothetical protein
MLIANPFQYFTEIEEHFQRRRGTILLLSTLDWALIETWKDAGIPLEAVLRGIDAAFEKFEKRPQVFRKVNSLAYCAQAVLEQAEQMKEAAVGSAGASDEKTPDAGLEPAAIAIYLRRNADELAAAALSLPGTASGIAQSAAATLNELAAGLATQTPRLEDLERHLTVLEEKLFAALVASANDADLLAVRSDADRDLAPYRSKMTAAQIEQLHKQYVHRRLLERWRVPRLSLFYM